MYLNLLHCNSQDKVSRRRTDRYQESTCMYYAYVSCNTRRCCLHNAVWTTTLVFAVAAVVGVLISVVLVEVEKLHPAYIIRRNYLIC